jgi:hypothetical protein
VTGALLFIAPWVLGYSGETTAFVTSLVAGGVAVIAGLLSSGLHRGWSWVSAAAGAYAVIAAIAIGGSGAALSSGIVLGAIIGIAGIANSQSKA